MTRFVALLVALCGACEAPADRGAASHANPDAAPVHWPLGTSSGSIGREVAPQLVDSLAIEGDVIANAVAWPVPGGGSARAVLAAGNRVELVELDRRRVAWQATCDGPVIAVTSSRIVCGARGYALDGKLAWTLPSPAIAVTNDRVVIAAGDNAVGLRDATSGDELAQVALPQGMAVAAACDRELYATTADGKLARIAGKLVWASAIGNAVLPDGIDPCDGPTLLAVTAGPSLVAIARDTGKLVGRVDGVRGVWMHGDSIEVGTAFGVVRYSRDLATSTTLALPALGPLIAARGDRRLVRATASTAVVLDEHGVRAFVPFEAQSGALGDDTLLDGDRLAKLPRAWRRPLRLPAAPAGIALPAELRDLPAPMTLDESHAIALPDGVGALRAIALDPIDPAIYAAAGDVVARFDLATRVWSWHRADACPADATSLAASRSIVACGSPHEIRATTLEGVAAWQASVAADELYAVADVVVARDRDRVRVLDDTDGHSLGELASSHVAAIDIAGMALVIAVEADRVVARLPRAYMLPAWSVVVRGRVRALVPAGDGVLVALEDGDAYRIDARTAKPTAVAGFGLGWQVAGDLVVGETAGGPVPPNPLPIPRPPLVPEVYKPVDLEAAPAIATPWPKPPPMPPSWQLAMFELGGGVRARDDYALEPPVHIAARRGAVPIVVVDHAHRLLAVDPLHGDPLFRVEIPDAAAAFSTIVDGRPVIGTILAAPLRVVTF
ncbi:MAG TPA: hypothetical protein VH143_14460 [Kofleriaceae bacterium]|jgi:hypothetical protein|nr:hypothetical protein [Kofleriaceae bacterium]